MKKPSQMKKAFITFGQDHFHKIGNQIFDKDCVACIFYDPSTTDRREKIFSIFGPKFCFEYPEEYFDKINLSYFPRGIITLEESEAEATADKH